MMEGVISQKFELMKIFLCVSLRTSASSALNGNLNAENGRDMPRAAEGVQIKTKSKFV